ncbi:MAG: ATP-dependent Clp protease proteolytic subunit [Kiritimatiellae bacterium]|nr:ATP-dependent Clp protease proteolytic subunit [Kiritimatiellia bacterium]
MYTQRKQLIQELEASRESRVLCYVTGDRRGLETQISSETYDLFVNHLDTIGPVKRISLYLYTRGGDTLAAWSIINLIRQFADELEVIVPSKCHSAGTLMCLGANSIIMTKQATLGPIDPSVNNPLNPQIPRALGSALKY